MTDKLITHDEAKKIIELSFDEYISLLSHKGISTNLTVKWKNEVINYITQNEQFAKDVAVLIDTLNSIKTICNKPSPSWILSLAEISNRYIEIDNLINTYQEKLSIAGKEE